MTNAARDRRVIDLAGRHQPEQRPGCLRGGRWRGLVAAVGELIARSVLAPAAVRVLDRDQPFDRAANLGRRALDAGDIERTQHGPGAVDVVGAPAAEPAAVLLLS